MPPATINLLIIEDREEDALLTLENLKRAGFFVSHVRVEDAEGLESALDLGGWHAVLTDFYLPGFNALGALRIVQRRNLDIPFLIVSGSIGEEMAVRAMKAGAHDYIDKANLSRLPVALARELREADIRRDRQRALDALADSENRFRLLADSAPVLLWSSDLAGNLTFANRAFLDLTGAVAGSFSQAWLQSIHPDDLPLCRASLNRRARIAEPYRLQYRLATSRGVFVRVLETAAPRLAASGSVFGYTSSGIELSPHDVITAGLLQHLQNEAKSVVDLTQKLAPAVPDIMALADSIDRLRRLVDALTDVNRTPLPAPIPAEK